MILKTGHKYQYQIFRNICINKSSLNYAHPYIQPVRKKYYFSIYNWLAHVLFLLVKTKKKKAKHLAHEHDAMRGF
jgi:hypothetical protein